jgi:coenzyme F420 hydrogenase subunit beta
MMDKRIVNYCTGCGLCKSEKKATLHKGRKGFFYPEDGDEKWLKQICPVMACQESYMDSSSIWGKTNAVYRGWSNDPILRKKASSGGVLTELASFLLDEKKVDGVIHICAAKDNPTKTEVCYSHSREELIERCGSRYAISHPLGELSKISYKKKYAFIGKPCDVVALKNYMEIKPELKDVITYTLSFFCMGLPSEIAQKNLLSALGVTLTECKELIYRGNGWPGFATFTDINGKECRMDYDTAWGKILGRDLMPACRFCMDGIGELADISCGDAWYLNEAGNPDFSEHMGRNVIFARTNKGAELVLNAQSCHRIVIEQYDNYEDELQKIQKSQYYRRESMGARILALKIMGRPYPAYSHKILSAYSSYLSKKKQLKICLGTCKRIFKGKI